MKRKRLETRVVLARLVAEAADRATARSVAESHLSEIGFSQAVDRELVGMSASMESRWRGAIRVAGLSEPVPVDVVLPAGFPDARTGRLRVEGPAAPHLSRN